MMQLKYLAHSSFMLRCGTTTLVFDPWLIGSAYYDQWFLWPVAPKNAEKISADAILISHGHEDHLHAETLRAMNKNARVFFPFQWKEGVKSFLEHIGYKKITEAVTLRTYSVNDVKITYLGYSLESVIVVEYKDEVMVNINDALNSNHENATNMLLKEIKTRWPKINYMLSGWSGASYFPNQVRYPNKDNTEIAKIREQYFANNFFRFSNYLQPAYAIPTPPGFMLLKKDNQWINHVKFPRTDPTSYYKQYFTNTDATTFLTPFPGDTIENGKMTKVSHLHDMSEKQQQELAYKHYEKQIEEVNTIEYVGQDKVDALIEQLEYYTNYNKILYNKTILQDSVFSIKVEDVKEETYINITYQDSSFVVKKNATPLTDRRLLITTSVKNLAYALSKVWGGDVLTVGYGITVDVYDQLTLEKNLDIVCIRLITRYPIAKRDMPRSPLRVLKFYSYNPAISRFWLKQKMSLKPYVNKYPFNERDHWLTYNKCDLCAVCKMPDIDLKNIEY